MTLAFPYHLNPSGRSATSGTDAHVRQMLEQLLLTSSGERVNRPDFGCGLLDLVFGPNQPQLAAGLTAVITASIQQWLGDVVELTGLQVESVDSTLAIDISYTVRATGQSGTAAFIVPTAP